MVCCSTGIATLEPPTAKTSDVTLNHPGALIQDHPDAGAEIAATVAALDDGLGAFRPSTSFNDLTNLIQNQGEVESSAVAPSEVPDKQDEAPAAKATKKRPAPPSSACPPPKQKCTQRARRQTSTKKQSTMPQTKKTGVVPVENNTTVPGTTAPVVVTPSGTAGEEAAATAAAAAVAASLPSLPEISDPAVVSSAPLPEAESKPETNKQPDASASGSSTGPSDSQFKSIAQQAVSNLIMNAAGSGQGTSNAKSTSTIPKDDSSDDESKSKVDTSTAHIKALTGNNWVAACTGSAPSAPSAPQPPVDTKSNNNNNNRVRRQNLTPDERARQNRDRNREHARNTRLRKKAYVEELKRTLTELVAQRDAVDLEKRQAAQREVEQREVRFRVMEEFIKLRGRNEPNFARWAAILEDGFTLTVPVSSFCKKVVGGELYEFEQKLNSVETVMAESTSFSEFLQTLGVDGSGAVTMNVVCDRQNFFMDGCNAMLEWSAVSAGGKSQVRMKGLVRGSFSPASNKLVSASISYDCGAIAAQVQHKGSSSSGEEIDVAAAQADAILDSLKIDDVHLNVVVPSDVSVVIPSNSSASVITEKGAESSDEYSTDHHGETGSKMCSSGDTLGMTTRRVHRRD